MSRAGSVRRFCSPSLVLMLAIGLGAAAMADKEGGKHYEDQNKTTTDQSKADSAKADQAEDQAGDPLKRPIEEKRRRANAKSIKQELSSDDKKWLNQDVRWIISDEEKKAFMQLSNEEEREQFIEAFCDRRNPNPDSEDNERQDEHYRRIQYSTEHYAAGMPGSMTHRGL